MKIYIAGPLFNEMERERNEAVASLIEATGHTTYLPQRDGGVFSQMLEEGKEVNGVRSQIFREDVEALESVDCILCLLDGRVPDEGMCIELGMAYALGKKCLGYKTDSRVFMRGGDNLMIVEILEEVFTTKDDLVNFFSNT